MSGRHGRRRLWVPEVIQTSSTDCGPACLASLLAGFGVPASYGHLRDVCYTDVDGTSIDDLEDIAVRFGLDAHQTMVPVEHLLHDEARALPAIVVLTLPSGVTHFVVLWRKLGAWVQMMDPAAGRRWIHQRDLRRVLHVHSATIPVEQWYAWACSEAFIGPLSARMLDLGLSQDTVVELLNQALDDESWRPLASLDAATRMLESIAVQQGAEAGRQAARRFAALSKTIPLADQAAWLPERWFSAHASADETTRLRFRAAVLITATGRGRPQPDLRIDTPSLAPETASPYRMIQQLFARARAEARTEAHTTPIGVLLQLVRMLGADGLLAPATLVMAAAFAGLVTAFEALLFKGLLDLERWIHAPGQRAAAVGVVALFIAFTLLVNLRFAQGVRTIGRRMETRLRVAFSRKLARLPDRYFSRRLSADLTQRIHAVVQLRGVPAVGESLLRSLFSLLFITAGIIAVDPGCTAYALIAAAAALGVPLVFQARLGEMQLSVATYQGGLSRYFLDALLGALPLRAHGGQEVLRGEHERMLGYWAHARRGLIRTSVLVETLIAAIGMLMSAVILYVHLERARDTSSVLLLLFWSQQLPQLGRTLAQSLMEYPARRAAAARLLEPINTPDDPLAAIELERGQPEHEERVGPPGLALAVHGVKLELGRTRILDGLDFELAPGCHCAVVGPSGAGKSSLLGLLLGWHRPSEGHIEIDGRLLDATQLARLRETTAWIDPQVLLWNRSLIENLRYGARGRTVDLVQSIEAADLRPVIDKLPEGLSTSLGEGGGMLSEGERQRVRLARALSRSSARLVLLDEPFRGLDRETRARYFGQLRRWWPGSTVLCVTHDVSETLGFDRVMVIGQGRIVEQGAPSELARRPGSVYRSMLEAEQDMHACFDEDPSWTRWQMQDGRLTTSSQRPLATRD